MPTGITPAPTQQATMHFEAVCHDCRRRHAELTIPLAALVGRMSDWHQKHMGHRIEYRSRYRHVPAQLNDRVYVEANETPWFLDYGENADIKLAYAASAAYTCTLAPLATSATLVAGRESTAISNTTNLYLDYGVGGVITVGTTPTANTTIEVWAYASRNDTPTYPDGFTGSDSNRSATTAAIKRAALALIAVLNVDTNTSNRGYHFRQTSLATALGGRLPKLHGLWVVHNTGVNLNATGGNHVLDYVGSYLTVA